MGTNLNLLGRNLLGRNLLGRNLLGRNLLGRNLLGRNLLGRNLLGRNLLGTWKYSLYYRLLVLTENILPSWKGLSGTNALAYLASLSEKRKTGKISTWWRVVLERRLRKGRGISLDKNPAIVEQKSSKNKICRPSFLRTEVRLICLLWLHGRKGKRFFGAIKFSRMTLTISTPSIIATLRKITPNIACHYAEAQILNCYCEHGII